ncbi:MULTISPECIES: hypothetical protein [Brevibacillus]|nr:MULTISPECIES: hypothetical protein [Brevibacillus]ELK43057.1 transcriptional regulator [Brevibacillus agri BAB-2500]MCG5252417.1 hypothetical protein [Brevibacillus agri]MDN4093728.1 hypothetical protein [Brevibacillus agri]MDR9506409.1 hypothetical protein [Brevibacillus agri]MED1821984.1 hypothetical protein [Brevibacillus agri]
MRQKCLFLMGIILDGQFYPWSGEAAGEIGSMMIGPVHNCPNGVSEFGSRARSSQGISL